MNTTPTIPNPAGAPGCASGAADGAGQHTTRGTRGLGLVLAGGLIAGALDLTFAFVFYGQQGVTPLRILQFIASAVLDRASFQMGLASAALGAFFHFFISVCAAAIYYLASLRFSFLTRRVQSSAS